MSNAVTINPALLTWARERAGVEAFMLEDRFPKLAAWEAGETQPTLAQLEKFAHACAHWVFVFTCPRARNIAHRRFSYRAWACFLAPKP